MDFNRTIFSFETVSIPYISISLFFLLRNLKVKNGPFISTSRCGSQSLGGWPSNVVQNFCWLKQVIHWFLSKFREKICFSWSSNFPINRKTSLIQDFSLIDHKLSRKNRSNRPLNYFNFQRGYALNSILTLIKLIFLINFNWNYTKILDYHNSCRDAFFVTDFEASQRICARSLF